MPKSDSFIPSSLAACYERIANRTNNSEATFSENRFDHSFASIAMTDQKVIVLNKRALWAEVNSFGLVGAHHFTRTRARSRSSSTMGSSGEPRTWRRALDQLSSLAPSGRRLREARASDHRCMT